MRRAFSAAAALSLILLAACATPAAGPRPTPTAPPRRPPPVVALPPRPTPAPPAQLRPADLPGWAQEDHLAALAAYQAGCVVDRASAETCLRAQRLARADDDAARRFFEENFRVQPVGDEFGLLTAYFAPEYEARLRPDGEFTAPVRPKPADLTPGQPYAERAEIEARPAGDALAWMRPEDLFFLQIQGSGVLDLPDGRRLKAAFAAHNGRPFVGIANPMRDRGLLAADNTSGEAIRGWLAAHGGPEADAIMRLNPRYVFFTLAPDDGVEPLGAAGLPLPAGHAVAIDPAFHAMGQLYWIDASAPSLSGAFPTYRRLVVALDTGGAIRGEVRADLYLGRGRQAGAEAGRVKHSLRMFRLVPLEQGR